ncbi:hypothetical protein HU200_055529 [Digitaria exilis]|uniref:Leucine-rich repeat-containing N-terminal plant-type domain-containing protein n=1 Tax=Digitaria exilis TaxID=1010633 RepID=A0A835AF18_9POAL|nr:hypothetical protein HU200_055529 [Digitaria exilis]
MPGMSFLPRTIFTMIAIAFWGQAHCNGDEVGTLLAFKAELTGHGTVVLPSWNASTGLCNWEGVGCSSGHVVALTLPSYGPTAASLRPSETSRLRVLALKENNLSGVLPHSLYNLSLLKDFEVQENMLSGTIAADIGDRFPSIEILSFANNQFSGSIPASLSNISSLTMLGLHANSFSGYVPHDLGRLQGLIYLSLNDNKLEANDTHGWEFMTSLSNCSQLQFLVLRKNSYSGQLPSSIENLSSTLQALYLGDNRISGVIPSNIGNLVGLKTLEMANTSVPGVIPESIGQLRNLVELGIYNTSLSGLIPSSLGNLTSLNRLYAYYNNLEGPVPTSFGKLNNLDVLDLSTNQLNGSIPRGVKTF